MSLAAGATTFSHSIPNTRAATDNNNPLVFELVLRLDRHAVQRFKLAGIPA